jgi:hypothetical protein
MVGGFVTLIVNDLYDFVKSSCQSTLPLESYLIYGLTVLVIAGFGLIAYDFWNRQRKERERKREEIRRLEEGENDDEDEERRKKKAERKWRFFPSGWK